MLALERAGYIMEQLQKKKVVLVKDLSSEMDVSEETIRKDLERLEKKGSLCRVHGGAYLKEGYGNEATFAVRGQIYRQEKESLALACMDLIRENESIILDCSTTALHIARALAASGKKCTVLTNSLEACTVLAGNPAIRLIAVGGEYRADTASFGGSAVIETLKQYRADKAVISSAGISLESGITDYTEEEAGIRRQMMAQSRETVFVADSTKIGRSALYVAGAWEKIGCLVTQKPFPAEQREFYDALEQAGIPVVFCRREKGKQNARKGDQNGETRGACQREEAGAGNGQESL